jgi:DNA-binding MarR family transcriptional regulator
MCHAPVMPDKITPESAQTLGFLLRLAYDELQDRVFGALPAAGFPDIRPAHSVVLRHIRPAGSRVSDLAEQARMTKQSMAYLVEALAEAGYVTIGPDPTDGRAKSVSLTHRGQKLARTLVRLSRKVEAEFSAMVNPGRMALLRDALSDLAAALRPRER